MNVSPVGLTMNGESKFIEGGIFAWPQLGVQPHQKRQKIAPDSAGSFVKSLKGLRRVIAPNQPQPTHLSEFQVIHRLSLLVSMLPLLSLLFSFALLINSVITFAEATPLPPGIPRALETSGFELCLDSPKSGFLFRVGFYDPQTETTTKSGPGVLVLCIGTNNCFGYTTTTTTMTTIAAPGTQHTVGTVIHTVPRRRSKEPGIYAPAYQELQITPNCDKFNHWSPTPPPPHAHDLGYNEPGTTLVEFLKSIENLRSALDHAHANSNLDITVAIDSPVSYILAVLDYLYSKGMLITYDKPSILDTISLPA
ncbi:hypothetical protein F5879DRAFT_1074174, partial [Lentinula edodes]